MFPSLSGIMGALLVLAGIVLVVLQFLKPSRYKGQRRVRSFRTEAGPFKFDFKTTYPGLLVIALGVILLIIDAITGR